MELSPEFRRLIILLYLRHLPGILWHALECRVCRAWNEIIKT